MEGGDNSPHGGEIADAGSDVEGRYDVINVTPVDRRFLCLKCGHMFPVKEAYLDHVKSKSCTGSRARTEPAAPEETDETPPPRKKPASPVVVARNFFQDPLQLTLGVVPPTPPPLPPLGSTSCRLWGKELGKEVGRPPTIAAAAADEKEVGTASEEEEVDLVLKL